MKRILAILSAISLVACSTLAQEVQPEFTPSHYNSFEKTDGRETTTRLFQKYVNYYEGEWKETDLTFVSSGGGFTVTNAPFGIVAPLTANGDFIFTDKHNYSIVEDKMRDDAPISKLRRFTGAQNVFGAVDGKHVRYPDAFLDGSDLLLELDTDEARYLVEWSSTPENCSTTISVPFEYESPDGLTGRERGERLPTTEREIEEVVFSVNDFRGIRTGTANIWDSLGNRQEVKIMAKRSGAKIVGRKIVPCSFIVAAFNSGASWVRTDDVDTFYPDPNVESTTVDGNVTNTSAVSTWDLIHDATDGSSSNDSGTSFTIQSQKAGATDFQIDRGIFLFNTASIADTNTISAATINLYATDIKDVDNDGQDYITITLSSPASNTAIGTADFDQVGEVSNPTKQSNDFDIGSLTLNAYNIWTLNATGISNISKTGVSKFGAREGHDIENAAISVTDANGNRLLPSSADETGTTQDPYLQVTHSAGAPTRRRNRGWDEWGYIPTILSYDFE